MYTKRNKKIIYNNKIVNINKNNKNRNKKSNKFIYPIVKHIKKVISKYNNKIHLNRI